MNLANGTERNHEPGERVSAAALEEMLDVALALLDEVAALAPAAGPVASARMLKLRRARVVECRARRRPAPAAAAASMPREQRLLVELSADRGSAEARPGARRSAT